MSGNPFPGPQPYRAADRKKFFARDAMVKKLANHILAYPATALFGPSGSGKSSLMQAGVIPSLEESDGMRVVRVDAWPSDKKPLRWLVNQMFVDIGLPDAPEENAPVGLKKAIGFGLRRSDRPILIYLDQLEQIFIAGHDDHDMQALLWGLQWLIRPALQQDVHLVLSLREDYVGRLRDWTRERAELSAHGFRVTPLTVKEILPAMCRTAREGNPSQAWKESDLRNLMLDVRVPGQRATEAADVQTAFAQIVCRALWDERAAGGTGTSTSNAEVILRRYLDTTLQGLGALQSSAYSLLEDKLVDPQGHRRLLTENEAREALKGDAAEVLKRLEDAAVLHAEQHQGSRYFELGHDWLAKKVSERRTERQTRALRVRLFAGAVVVALVVVGLGSLTVWALGQKAEADRQRDAAQLAQTQATQDRDKAVQAEKKSRRASRIAAAREAFAKGHMNIGALVLQEVEDAHEARGWQQLALDFLDRPLATRTFTHTADVPSAAWSPDSQYIVTASADKAARIWRADGHGDPIVLPHPDGVLLVAFSPDGKRVATASADKLVRLWTIASPDKPLVLGGHDEEVTTLAFRPDGRNVLTASQDKTARIWYLEGQTPPLVLPSLTPLRAASFSPDGTLVATAGTDSIVRLLRSDGNGRPVVLGGHEGTVITTLFTPDGTRLITASYDGSVRVWRTDGPTDSLEIGQHEHLSSVALSPNGDMVATGSEDGSVRIWLTTEAYDAIADVASSAASRISGHEHKDAVLGVAFSPNSRQLISASRDKTARLGSPDLDTAINVLEGHDGALMMTLFSPDGRHVLTVSEDKAVKIWPAYDASGSVHFVGHTNTLTAVAFAPDGRHVATAAQDNTARIWPADGKGEPVVLKGHEYWLTSVAFSPNGQRIATGAQDHNARIWSLDGQSIAVLKGHERNVTGVDFSPDGKHVATASLDKTVRIWPVESGGEPVVLRGYTHEIGSVHFSPDGQFIVTASEDSVALIRRVNGEGDILVLRGHEGPVRSAEYSADGKWVVTASEDNTARIWNANGQGDAIVLRGHDSTVTSASFSHDGRYVITSSLDKTTRIWRSDGQDEPLVLRTQKGLVADAALSPDGQRVLIGSTDGNAHLHAVSIPLLQEALRQVTTDCLSPMQREMYLLENATDARAHYEACERRYDRTPRDVK